MKPTINFEDFEKIDLRVGEIQAVTEHPEADKLYVLKVNFGDEGERTIVAGLKKYYPIEDLEGKSALFVINLEPRKLRGIESQGMILALVNSEDETASILTPDKNTNPGTKAS